MDFLWLFSHTKMLRTLLLPLLLFLLPPSTTSQFCPSLLTSPFCTLDSHCSPGGTCARGACVCASGRIGTNCATVSQGLIPAGTFIVTQAGLDLAPLNYFAYVNDAYERAKLGSLGAAQYNGACIKVDGSNFKTYLLQLKPLTQSMFTKSDLDPGSVRFAIVSGGVRATGKAYFEITRAKLNLWGGAFCCPCSGSDCRDTLCPNVCSSTDAEDWIDFSFTATVSADIILGYSGPALGVTANVQNVAMSFDDSSLGAVLTCPKQSYNFISNMVLSAFQDVKSSIAPTLIPKMTQNLQAAANAKAAQYQGLQSYKAFDGVYVKYIVTGVTVTSGVSIVVAAQTIVVAELFWNTTVSNCGVNVTYVETASDAALLPPTTWSPLVKTLAPIPYYAPVAAGMRLSRSLLNGLTWAKYLDPTYRTIKFDYTNPASALYAQASFSFSPPIFNIPNDGQLGRIRASTSGKMTMSCYPTQALQVLSLDYSNLQADFRLVFDNSLQKSTVSYQVVTGNLLLGSVSNVASLDAPIMTPTVLQSALVGAMNFQTPQIQDFLLKEGNGVFTMPPDLQQQFPGASIEVKSQGSAGSPAIDNASGYIEILNRCACSSSSIPISANQPDGQVAICPRPMLGNGYCNNQGIGGQRLRALSLWLRLDSPWWLTNPDTSPVRRSRSLQTTQQQNDLTTVLATIGNRCITDAPTKAPTTPRPTPQPSKFPTLVPTTPTVPTAQIFACQETNGCRYELDVLFFVCRQGYAEVRSCRRENSDIYCCPTGYLSSTAALLQPGGLSGNMIILYAAAVLVQMF